MITWPPNIRLQGTPKAAPLKRASTLIIIEDGEERADEHQREVIRPNFANVKILILPHFRIFCARRNPIATPTLNPEYISNTEITVSSNAEKLNIIISPQLLRGEELVNLRGQCRHDFN